MFKSIVTNRISLTFLAICMYYGSNAQLSGTYTIGGTSPSYATFTLAVSALTTNGVSGPVVFNVRDGVYNEQISIWSISGASATNTITFQSQSADSTLVTLTYSPSSSYNYTIRLNGCDYVNFFKMKLKATGTSYSTVIRYESNANYNRFENNIIEGSAANSSTSSNQSVIYGASSYIGDNRIFNNIIKDGSIGIYLSSSSSSSNFQIVQNSFSNQYYRALDLNSLSSLTITGNTIASNTSYYYSEGISITSCGSNLVLTYNKLNLTNAIYGLYMVNSTTSSSSRGLIANNFISIAGNSYNAYGIYFYNTNYQNIYYNSINITRSGSSNYALYLGGSSTTYIQLQNNVFSCPGGGFPVSADYSSNINVSDYNDLYTTGNYIGNWNGSYCTTLANWRTVSSQDMHSVSILPEFPNSYNLHMQSYLLDNLGYPVSGVSDDIDGQTRSTFTPDIGADEWTTPLRDAGVTSIDQSLTYCIVNDSVFATIKNFGTANLTSVSVNWTVNGSTQTARSWTGNLTQGSSFGPFSLGYYNFSLGSQYSVYAWTSNPNGYTEGFNHNDSSWVLNKYKAMSGNYTIGGSSPDYSTINAAVTDLVNGGVCGPVVFNIRNGVYNETVSIGPISGTSSTNTVTFQSQSLDSTLVTLTSTPISSANYTLRFNGCDYVIIRKMKLRASGTSYSTVVRFESSSNYNKLENNLIEGASTNNTTYNQAVIYGSSYYLSDNQIDNNIIKDGSMGVNFSASSSPNIVISQNTFINQYYRALDLYSLSSLTVTKNTVSSNSSYYYFEGMYLSGCGSSLVLTYNKLNLTNAYYGIDMVNSTSTSTTRGLIANNFISIAGYSGNAYGIYFYNTNYQNIYFNSINITRSGSSTYALYFGGSSTNNMQLQNNVLSCPGGGYPVYTDYSSNINVSDYNDLYTTGNYIGNWNGSYCTTLANWRTVSSQDMHSVSILPEFPNSYNLHMQSYLLDNLGYPVSGVTDDIDGQTRSLFTPDIGADEWTTPLNDAGVTSIDQGLTYCITNDSVFATIKNYGSTTLDTVTVNWSVNGITQTVKTWTGSLSQGNSYGPFSLGYYNFSLGSQYSVYAWTSSPNGSPEGFNHNDSSRILNKYKAMSGTYTIGGTNPNYATFNAAITDLVNGGVCGPVVFNVRNAVYNEQVSIAAIEGTSATNTVVFQSETGDSNAVSITYAPVSSSNYTVRFNGCNYVIFRKIKVIATGTSYANVFRFESSSYNNMIDRCLVIGANTTSTSSNLAAIYSSAYNLSNNIITGNKISDGSIGIYISTSSSNIQIIQNTLQNQYYRALDLTGIYQLTVSRNTITSNTNYAYAEGVYLSSCGTNLLFTRNRITLTYAYYGLNMYSCTSASTLRGTIANNFISLSGSSGTCYGIYLYNTNYQNFYYNSVNISVSGSNSYAFYTGGSSSNNIQLQNNVISNPGGGMCFYSDYSSQINVSDYNNLYTAGNYLGYRAGNYCTSLSVWRSLTGLDVHSFTVVPGFFSASDLHLCNTTLSNAGVPVSGITDDFDGQSRNSVNPDIGADEFGSTLTVNLGSDIFTCSSVQLNAGIPNSRYLWSTGDTLQTLTVTTSGTYWVRVTNACGQGSDTIVVRNTPPVPANVYGPDSLCANRTGSVYSIASVNGATTYNWTVPTGWQITSGQGSTSVTVSNNSNSGNICVTAGSGCAFSQSSCKSVSINLSISAPSGISGDTTVCPNDTSLNYSCAAISGALNYTWTVPGNWTIVSGQGTTAIKVNSGSTAGNICVSVTGSCNTTSPVCKPITISTSVANPGSISGLKTICSNQTGISYFISAVNGASSYNWTVPVNWTIVSGQGSTSITVDAGSLGGDICVTALNSCSVSQSSCATIAIKIPPAIPDSIYGPTTVCSGQGAINYNVTAVSGATGYNWTVPSGWNITGGQGTNQITVDAGTSSGSICVSSTNSCVSANSKCLSVTVLTIPGTASIISGDTLVCQGQSGLAYSTPLVNGATSYTWSVSPTWNIQGGQGSNIINVISGSNSGNICVIASNICGSATSKCLSVTAQSLPAKPSVIIGDTFVCGGQSGITYSTPYTNGATSYLWTVTPTWSIQSGQGSNIINVLSGNISGNICVTVSNACGSGLQKCQTIGLLSGPAKPSAITGEKYICSGESDLEYTVSKVTDANSYVWTLPSGWSFISGQGTDKIVVSAGTTGGTISAIAVNNCGTSSAVNYLIMAYPLPPQPVITQNSKILSSSSATGNQWYLNDTLIPGADKQDYTAGIKGWYTVKVTDANGCSAISAPLYFVSTSVTDKIILTDVVIYPNPAKGAFNINIQNASVETIEIQISDMPGRLLYSKNLKVSNGNVFTVDPELPVGVYMITIKSGDRIFYKKLVVE